ncbi:MAG: dihydroneopterin aldolase [Bacteroidota bacterium]|jgi:dihydroneopterin aldolase
MKHKIFVSGIKCYAYHGCLPEEGRIGGHYEVNIEIQTNFSKAAEHDSLADTIDYVDVNRIVIEEMAISSKLIEHVGQRIVTRMKTELSGIENLKVQITKICPPINGDVASVAITIEA